MLLSKIIFYVFIFLLPLNLGKHLDIKEAFVDGFLVDYLQPVVFVQDILIFLILILWIWEIAAKKIKISFSSKGLVVYTLFIFSLLLSVLNSAHFYVSAFSFIRFFLYSFVFVYVLTVLKVEKDLDTILKILFAGTMFLCFLGIIQFIKQGAVFNNYLFFGEQPYTKNSWEVTRERFLNYSFIPPYSLFRHPNIFGGFLSIVLLWFFFFRRKHTWFKYVFYLGLINLVLTFSILSWISFGLGFLGGLFLRKKNRNFRFYKLLFSIFILGVIIFVLFTPIIGANITIFNNLPSIFRRSGLLGISYFLIKQNFLFGVGWNSSIFYTIPLIGKIYGFYFAQPVHNIFVLLFVEAGFFSFILFLLLLFLAVKKQLNNSVFYILFISLLQIMFLGCFDHYFLTIHQTVILMWLTMALSFL